jgi:hypothetical protein
MLNDSRARNRQAMRKLAGRLRRARETLKNNYTAWMAE